LTLEVPQGSGILNEVGYEAGSSMLRGSGDCGGSLVFQA
jgi:hypothetical protein